MLPELGLEDAMRKTTSLPAGELGLENRGLIKEDFQADIVIFDPGETEDEATYTSPHQYPEGIDYVIVNEQIVGENGSLTGALPGILLNRHWQHALFTAITSEEYASLRRMCIYETPKDSDCRIPA